MTTLLRSPLPMHTALLAALALVILNTAYCLSYSALAGGNETIMDGVVWTLVNILPWFAAFELGKRQEKWSRIAWILIVALLLSLALGLISSLLRFDLAFETVRRIPAALFIVALLAIGRYGLRRSAKTAAPTVLPVPPSGIDRVVAAGNYVELHAGERIILVRAGIGEMETQLRRHGFVRTHRSHIVRRELVTRITPQAVELSCGASVPVGARYRAAIGD